MGRGRFFDHCNLDRGLSIPPGLDWQLESEEDWISVAIQTGPVLMLLPRAGGGLSTSVPWLPDPAQCVIAIATISVIVGAIRTRNCNRISPPVDGLDLTLDYCLHAIHC